MPWGDGTGPMGMGPMTGRGAGFCAGYGVPGYMNPIPGGGFGYPGAYYGGATALGTAGRYPLSMAPYGYGAGYGLGYGASYGPVWGRGAFGRGFGRGGFGRGFGRGRGRGRGRW